MELETFTHARHQGWSIPSFPELDSPETVVLVFGAPEYREDPSALRELAAAYPTARVVGCSSSGEIAGTQVSDETLSVAVARFEHTRLRTAIAPMPEFSDAHSLAAGRELAEALQAPDLRHVLILSDGLKVNGTKLIEGLNAVLPESVVVTGGLAGDGSRFGETWVLREGLPQPGYITAVGFYGDRLKVSHGSKGGWDKFGPERVVTRSQGSVLYELDGKPALQLYKDYLGDRASGLPATGLLFPLAMRSDTDDERTLVRTLLSVDEASQSMTFAGDLPQGSLVQLMRANFDRLIDGASGAAKLVLEHGEPAGDTLAIAISCVGRRLVLGERTEEEVEATLEVLPEGTRQVGFYSYGEISPYANGRCDLHNQTMTLTTLSEI
ncbi:MAG: FIST N-terminal domain-containing protein [bacterium]|nr:FIST N-terminal domain-containing protein [bacterium]